MRVEAVTDLASLRALWAEWSALPLPSPMQSPEWLVSWWEAYGEDDPAYELTTLALHDDAGRLVGLAPWYTRRRASTGPTLRQLGDGRASSDHGTLLCRAEDEPAVVTAAARWLGDSAGEGWRRVRFEAINDDDRAMNHLQRLLDEAGLDTERVADIGSFPAELASAGEDLSWDGYLATLSKNRRKRLRRWRRECFDTGRAETHRVCDVSELGERWPTLVRLHAERREGMGETGVFDCPRFNRFQRLAAERLLAEDRLYFAVLELDGETVAAEYSLQDASSVYAYQGGIAANALDRDAGHLSMIGLVDHAIATGRSRLDLLRGDEPYKQSWGATHRPASTLHVRPRDAAGTLERWAGNAYRAVRDARRQRRWAKSQSQT